MSAVLLLVVIALLLIAIAFPGAITGFLSFVTWLVIIGFIGFVFHTGGVPVQTLVEIGAVIVGVGFVVRIWRETNEKREIKDKLADLRNSGDSELVYHASVGEQQLKSVKKAEDRKKVVREIRARWDSMQAVKEHPVRKNRGTLCNSLCRKYLVSEPGVRFVARERRVFAGMIPGVSPPDTEGGKGRVARVGWGDVAFAL